MTSKNRTPDPSPEIMRFDQDKDFKRKMLKSFVENRKNEVKGGKYFLVSKQMVLHKNIYFRDVFKTKSDAMKEASKMNSKKSDGYLYVVLTPDEFIELILDDDEGWHFNGVEGACYSL